MKNFYSLIIFLLFLGTTFAQAPISIIKPKKAKALIIGVSDYQNIKGLSYAHLDAAEFADYLKKNRGWQLGDDDVQLLTNENAKQGDILLGLQWLLDAAQDGEDVIFYFSGHGDVETVGTETKGFLLANDSPKNNYPLGGTIEVSLLDSVFTTLVNRDIKVWAIVDACRSGSLAGGMSGKQQTNEALAKQWANQIRILSAQPDQQSLEAKTWGGGHGVFSYYLVKGMAGFANSNADSKITLSELENYLGNNINTQTQSTQQPHVDGANKFNFQVAIADSLQMSTFASDKVEGEISLAMNTKSGEWKLDPICVPLADTFEILLSQGLTQENFLKIKKQWDLMSNCAKVVPDGLRYTYMRSLINSINKVINVSLSGEKLAIKYQLVYGIDLIEQLQKINEGKRFLMADHFASVLDYFKTVGATMYADDFMFQQKLVYEIYSETNYNNPSLEELRLEGSTPPGVQILKVYETGEFDSDSLWYGHLHIDIEASYFEMKNFVDFQSDYLFGGEILVHLNVKGDRILVLSNHDKEDKIATEVSFRNLENSYMKILNTRLKVESDMEPDAAYLYYSRAMLFNNLEQTDSALVMLDKCIALAPKWLNPLYAKAQILRNQKRFKESISTFEQVLKLDSVYQDFECLDCFFMGLINLYVKENQLGKIDPSIEKWVQMRGKMSSKLEVYNQLITDRSSSKREKNFWLKRMRSLEVLTVEDQFQVIYNQMSVNKKAYSVKDIIEFNQEILRQLLLGNDHTKSIFENKAPNRSKQFKSKIWKDYFKDGESYQYVDSFQLLKHLSMLTEMKQYSKWLGKKKIRMEDFILATIVRNESVEWYASWAELFLYQIQFGDINPYVIQENGDYVDNRAVVREKLDVIKVLSERNKELKNDSSLTEEDQNVLIGENESQIYELYSEIETLQSECASAYFAEMIGLDINLFQTYYAPFLDNNFFSTIMNGLYYEWDFWYEKDYKQFEKNSSNFEDVERLKQIPQLMKNINDYFFSYY